MSGRQVDSCSEEQLEGTVMASDFNVIIARISTLENDFKIQSN